MKAPDLWSPGSNTTLRAGDGPIPYFHINDDRQLIVTTHMDLLSPGSTLLLALPQP